MAAALVSSSVFGLVATGGAWLTEHGLVAPLRLGRSRATPGGVAAAIVGTVGLSVSLGEGAELLGLGKEGQLDRIASALAHLAPAQVLIAIGSLAVLPAVAEEALFRGLVQTRLIASWGRWTGIAGSAAAFGIIHFDPVQGTVAFAAGLLLGWVAERFGSIRPTIAAHMANNAISVAALCFFGSQASSTARGLRMAAGAAALLGSIAVLRSPRSVKEPPRRQDAKK
jgi:membrane protease YdiL (CAAX protease family)